MCQVGSLSFHMESSLEQSASSRSARSAPRILPLPADEISQITSSIAITSLIDVLIGLVKNALDARANKIDVSLDFALGNCIVEDNGIGIAADEFSPDGGLIKPFWTSKSKSAHVHGCRGTFLSAVAATSHLTISSRQVAHESLNVAVFHQSKLSARHVPAPPGHELILGRFGTRVTVRNLFGNMPVRVKQRAIIEDSQESSRSWKSAKSEIVALLLAWSRPIGLTLHDEKTGSKLVIRENYSSLSLENSLFDTKNVLNILIQSSYFLPNSRASWVPLIGSSSSISVKGAISLNPTPNKSCQFISIGIQPLSNKQPQNMLYDEVNRLFSSSRFGVVDEDEEMNRVESEQRMNDARFEQNGLYNKSLRKGIDRWPMFYLNIIFGKIQKRQVDAEDYLFHDDDSRLKALIDILNTMTTRWLTENHFLNERKKQKGKRDQNDSKDPISGQRLTELQDQIGDDGHRRGFETRECSNLSYETNTSHLVVKANQLEIRSAGFEALSTWSRIKSGRNGFYEKELPKSRFTDFEEVGYNPNADNSLNKRSSNVLFKVSSPGADSTFDAGLSVNPSPFGSARMVASTTGTNEDTSTEIFKDDFMEWRHPRTKQLILVNKRSGTTIPRLTSRDAASQLASNSLSLRNRHEKTHRLFQGQSHVSDGLRSQNWFDGFLSKWKNPVFQNPESGIQQASTTFPGVPNDIEACCHDSSRHCISLGSLSVSDTFSCHQLSVAGLEKATVIAQVGEKFILAKVPLPSTGGANIRHKQVPGNEILVAIDQHAADERCRVESLFMELCEKRGVSSGTILVSNLGQSSSIKTSTLQRPITFQITTDERDVFKRHAAFFARWGILYDIFDHIPTKKITKVNLKIRSIPPGIVERCVAEPRLAVELLRTEAWRQEDHPSRNQNTQSLDENRKHDPRPWLQALSSCPQSLIDMLNSRACRSSIMFNDHLEVHECQELIMKLSKCAFPFQCAHGRPSLAPLVDLGVMCSGSDDRVVSEDPGISEAKHLGFAGDASNVGITRAYRRWIGGTDAP